MIRIPSNLRDAAKEGDREDRNAWLAGLPALIDDLCERWSLDVGDPFEPGGQCSWVAPATSRAGEELVLKVGRRHSEAEHEPDALRLWDGEGAVRLHEVLHFADTTVLLLERCNPGIALSRTTAQPDQDRIVCDLLPRLWREAPPGHPFRPLQDMCDEWATEFDNKLERLPDRIDPGVAREGIALFRALPRSAEQHMVLCTDLHGANILAARREPWLVIDPKPYVGDPAYDTLQHMLNCEERLATDPAGLAQRMADLLELDGERVRLWLFARCVQESIVRPLLYNAALAIAP